MNNDDRTGGGLCGNAAVVGFKYTYSENCTRWIIVCLAAAQPHRMAMRVAIRAAFRHDFPFPLLTGAGKRSIISFVRIDGRFGMPRKPQKDSIFKIAEESGISIATKRHR